MKESNVYVHADNKGIYFCDIDEIIEFAKGLYGKIRGCTKKNLIKALENTKEKYHLVEKNQGDNVVESPASITFDWLKNIDVSYSNKQYGLYQLCPKCDGRGCVQAYGTMTMETCDVCNGDKIIPRPTE